MSESSEECSIANKDCTAVGPAKAGKYAAIEECNADAESEEEYVNTECINADCFIDCYTGDANGNESTEAESLVECVCAGKEIHAIEEANAGKIIECYIEITAEIT